MNQTTSPAASTAAPHVTLRIYRLTAHGARSARALISVDKDCREHHDWAMKETKFIWLPGNEGYPMQWLSQCDLERHVCGHRLVAETGGSGRYPSFFKEEVNRRSFDVILHLARERAQRKMLPSFTLTRSSHSKQFHVGSGDMSCGSLWSKLHIAIDEIRGLSDEFDGAYGILMFDPARPNNIRSIVDQNMNDAAFMIGREGPLVFGDAPEVGKDSPWRHYHDLVKKVTPDFPW